MLITRNHYRNFGNLNSNDAFLVLGLFRNITESWRPINASLTFQYFTIGGRRPALRFFHPHYQIISIPVVPPDVSHSLAGSARYFKIKRMRSLRDDRLGKKKQKSDCLRKQRRRRFRAVCLKENRLKLKFSPKNICLF